MARVGSQEATIKSINLKVPLPLHQDIRKCAALDRRSMTKFCLAVIENRVHDMLQEDMESKGFVPLGLRTLERESRR